MNNLINKNNLLKPNLLLPIAITAAGIAMLSIITTTIIRSLNGKVDVIKAEAPTTGTSSIAIAIAGDNNNTNGNINLNIKPTKKNNIAVGSHTITVNSNNTTGYNISLQTTTNNNNLVNSNNPNVKIKPIDSTKEQPKPLTNKTWGYAIATDSTQTPTTFSPVQPKEDNNNTNNNAAKTIISSQTPTPVSGTSTTIYYGVSLYDVDIAQYAGTYRTTVEYTITANPSTNPNPTDPEIPETVEGLQCSAENTESNIQVDIDANMIPIRYVGNQNDTNSGWVKADKANANSSWFNYNNKQWANAVTVTDPTKYKNAAEGTPILNSDIKGYWVYIPRYDYCVERFNGTDPAIQPKNFNIRLKTNKDQKHTPTGNNTWATHPAFTWGDTELNGFWMAKFELTGSRTAPTVLPNRVPNSHEFVGSLYNIIKSIGVEDSGNTGGGCSENGDNKRCLPAVAQYNHHNLNKSSSHMLKNSEWGAAAYLSASQYGAGVNNVQINPIFIESEEGGYDDDEDRYTYGITGCGPSANGDETARASYDDCGGADFEYTGPLGQLASTTNNVYGVYDMSGGYWEAVMGGYNLQIDSSIPSMAIMPVGKYVDNYPSNPFEDNGEVRNQNQCTWQHCGGHALHETLNVQAVSAFDQAWGGDGSYFADANHPWITRGGESIGASYAGVFATSNDSENYTARAALIVLHH